jgi:hypothetical protein
VGEGEEVEARGCERLNKYSDASLACDGGECKGKLTPYLLPLAGEGPLAKGIVKRERGGAGMGSRCVGLPGIVRRPGGEGRDTMRPYA